MTVPAQGFLRRVTRFRELVRSAGFLCREGLQPLYPRERQIGRKAETQSQGPAVFLADGSLVAERMIQIISVDDDEGVTLTRWDPEDEPQAGAGLEQTWRFA